MADAYIEKGATYEIDGKVFECLEFLHVKPGKGSAFVRTKLKDEGSRVSLRGRRAVPFYVRRGRRLGSVRIRRRCRGGLS